MARLPSADRTTCDDASAQARVEEFLEAIDSHRERALRTRTVLFACAIGVLVVTLASSGKGTREAKAQASHPSLKTGSSAER